MKLLALALPLLTCASSAPANFCTTPCGLSVAAENRKPQYTCDEYVRVETAIVGEAPSLPVCRALSGATAWELPGNSSVLGGVRVAGWSECALRRFMFHTNDGVLIDGDTQRRHVWHTAFAHEAVHLAQGCLAPLPVDPGRDEAHANWSRDGLFDAVDRANREAAREAP